MALSIRKARSTRLPSACRDCIITFIPIVSNTNTIQRVQISSYRSLSSNRSTAMLLASTQHSYMPNQHLATYAPTRSSPLRERSANAGAGLFDFSVMSQHSENQTAQSRRVFKANPVMQTRDAATKRRRDLFFKRVQNNRDDKKWESRGEQVRHTSFRNSQLRVLNYA